MAEKILSIKLNIDTSQGGKLFEVIKSVDSATDKLASTTKNLSGIEQKRADAISAIRVQYERLSTIAVTASDLIATKARGWNVAERNVQSAVEATTKKLQEQLDILRSLRNAQNLGAGSARADSRPTAGPAPAGYSFATGSTRSATNPQLETIRNFNEATTRIEREASDRRLFHEQANINARTIAYAHMFDQIASGEARLTSRTTGQLIAAQVNNTTQAVTRNTEAIHTNTSAVSANNASNETAIVLSRNLFIRAAELIGVYRIFNAVLNTTREALIAIPKAGLEQQATQASLLGIFGTEEGQKNIAFVKQIAQEAGQSLLTLEQAYRRYAPSATLAGASQESVNKSFKDFAEVGTILKLPEDKINSLFLALDQMYAKGTVQSEEIKKQLGNVLPGAVEIGAQAIGKSPAAFMAAMKKNEIIATEFVPVFAAKYREIFGGPDDSVFNLVKDKLQSNLFRLENAYVDVNRRIFADTQSTMNGLVKAAADMVGKVSANIKGIEQSIELLSEFIIIRLAGAAIGLAITNFGLLATKISAFSTVITGLSAPMLAVGSSIVYLYGVLNGLNIEYEKATGFTVKFGEEQVSLTNYLRAGASLAVDGLAGSYKNLNEEVLKTVSWPNLNVFFSTMLPGKEEIDQIVYSFQQLYATIQTIGQALTSGQMDFKLGPAYEANLQRLVSLSKTYQPIIAKAASLDAEDILGDLNGASFDEIWKAVDEKRLKGAENIRKALESASNIPQTAIVGAGVEAITDPEVSKALEEANKLASAVAKAAIREIESEAKLALARLKTEQEAVDDKVRLRQLSFNDAYKERLRISKEILAVELNKANKEIAVTSNKPILQEQSTGSTVQFSAAIEKYSEAITKAADKWKVPADYIKAVMSKESGGVLGAININKGGMNRDLGLMQVNTKAHPEFEQSKLLTNAAYNIDAGTKILAESLRAFPDDLIKGFAAYNAGIGGAAKGTSVPYGEDVAKRAIGSPNRQIAQNVKDSVDISVQVDTIERAYEADKQRVQEADKLLQVNREELATLSNIVEVDFLRASGLKEQADILELNNKYRVNEELLAINGLETERKKVVFIKSQEVLQLSLNKLSERRAAAEQLYQNKVEEVQTLLAAGVLSQREAINLLNDSKKETLRLQDLEIEKLREQIKLSGGKNIEAQDKLNAIQQSKNMQYAQSVGGLSSTIQSGMPSELNFLVQNATNQAKNEEQLRTGMAAIDSLRLTNHEEWLAKKAALDDKYNTATQVTAINLYSGMAGVATTGLESIAKSTAAMYGNNSKQARAAFIAYKAMAVAQAVMTTATAVMSAFDSGAKVPLVGPVTTGPAYAAMAAAIGAVQIATIIAQPMPQAHGGLDYVPENNKTYLLSKGERVLQPNANKDLTKALQNGTLNQSKQPIVNNNKIINVLDPSIVGDYLSTTEGENLIMNVVSRNQAA